MVITISQGKNAEVRSKFCIVKSWYKNKKGRYFCILCIFLYILYLNISVQNKWQLLFLTFINNFMAFVFALNIFLVIFTPHTVNIYNNIHLHSKKKIKSHLIERFSSADRHPLTGPTCGSWSALWTRVNLMSTISAPVGSWPTTAARWRRLLLPLLKRPDLSQTRRAAAARAGAASVAVWRRRGRRRGGSGSGDGGGAGGGQARVRLLPDQMGSTSFQGVDIVYGSCGCWC